jgi:hypothetical protein
MLQDSCANTRASLRMADGTLPPNQGPMTKGQGPRAKGQGPRAKGQGPRAKANEPRTKAKAPATRTKAKGPRTTNHEPGQRGQGPRISTRGKRVRGQGPRPEGPGLRGKGYTGPRLSKPGKSPANAYQAGPRLKKAGGFNQATKKPPKGGLLQGLGPRHETRITYATYSLARKQRYIYSNNASIPRTSHQKTNLTFQCTMQSLENHSLGRFWAAKDAFQYLYSSSWSKPPQFDNCFRRKGLINPRIYGLRLRQPRSLLSRLQPLICH